MPITKNDIKLLASERMTDNADGGGRATGNIIIGGQSNNIFPDISELDRTYGRVNLRKVFPAVYTLDTDSYMGSNLILDTVPDDENVDALIFDTTDWDDTRAGARNKIESYVVRGPKGPWFLYERQLEGQRSILLFASVNAKLPVVGDVVYLVEDEDLPTEFSQYCRITDVSDEIVTFQAGSPCNTFQRKIITVEIGNPLKHTFEGAVITCLDNITPAAIIRTTQVADASKYYGASTLKTAAAIGDIEVEVASVYAALVPSTRGETPVVDVQPGGQSAISIESGPETFSIVGPANTGGIPVTLGNRALNYTYTCTPIPAPGVLTIEYRALGRWYIIQDDGTGAMAGDGSGVINFSTGSVIVTLLALPDVGSEILFSWSSAVHYIDRAGSIDIDPIIVQHTLGMPCEPGSLTATWTAGGAAKTATADITGAITGDAIGRVVNSTGELFLEFAELPDQNTQITFDYDEVQTTIEVISGLSAAGGIVAFALAGSVRPGSLSLSWEVLRERVKGGLGEIRKTFYDGSAWRTNTVGYYQTTYTTRREVRLIIAEDGAGNLDDGRGTIVYATSDVSLKVAGDYSWNLYSERDGLWVGQTSDEEFLSGQVIAKYTPDSATPTARSESIDLPPLSLHLLRGVSDTLVPGTVRFKIGATNYSDRVGLGTLYLDDGTVAGTVDYKVRLAQITSRPSGAPQVAVTSLVSTFGNWYSQSYRFRTPGAPIQPGSLLVNGTATDGTLITATSDQNGVIDHANAQGAVNQDQGVAHIRYGALVADSSLTPEEKSEDWYDPADIDGSGNIWKPIFVYPNTVRFNCVVYTFLPLDADILGLDPVRLPSDGRVPIFRPADVAVIHHTATIVIASPTNGQVIDSGRVRLERVDITDGNGDAFTDFTANLDTGIITLGSTAGAAAAPLSLAHRISDQAVVSDVQIDGKLRVTRQLTHDFPALETYVSSAMIFGDMAARWTGLFEQETWTGEWSDSLIGDAPTASYDSVTYPLVVTNRGTLQERWAIIFTSATSFKVVGEHVGQIAIGDTTNALAPVNPQTGQPYFSISELGWGAGWSTGNVLRFNTIAANHPSWLARCTQQGPATNPDDSFCIGIRGDIDA